MCLGLGLLERLTGARGARKAAQQAARQANQQAVLAAEASQNTLENSIEQQRNAAMAAELAGRPVESTDVAVGTAANIETDETTGRRRTNRARFQFNAPGSGLSI